MIQQSHSQACIWTKLIQKDTCTGPPPHVHSSTSYNTIMKQTKCPQTRSMDKEDVVYIQWKITWPLKNEIMTFAATWMDLEIAILSEVTSDQSRSDQSLSRVRLCDPMNCSTPGLPVHHQLQEFTQTHVYRVGDDIQPSHPLPSPSPPAPNPSQHQSLFQ